MNALTRWFEALRSKGFAQVQAGLAKLAIEAGPDEWNLRAAQMNNELTDQELIRKVALEAKGAPIRRAVIHKLMDQSLVAKIAVEDVSDMVAEAAVAELKDQEKIAEVAIQRPATCRVALDKLTEQRWIEKLALEATEPSIRKYAFWRLKDPSPELMALYGSKEPAKGSPHLEYEFFIEANAVGSGLGIASLEVIENVINTADRELELHGRLREFCNRSRPNFIPVDPMTSEQWKAFLDRRAGNPDWSRWHGENSGNRYNVICYA